MKRPLKTSKIVLFVFSTFISLVFVYFVNGIMFTSGIHAICVPIFTLLRIVIICVLIGYFYLTQENPILFGMLLGSAVYLLIESSVLGCVRDYFNLAHLFKFNISDVLITFSSLGIVLSGLKTSASKYKN
jgi:lipoprotein signal peptidase